MTAKSSTDRIEKQIELKAPVSRVWRALTDHREFGTWFKAKLETPFKVGEICRGKITYPGYEHLPIDLQIVAMEPERRFAFEWLTGSDNPARLGETDEPRTTVEFLLEKTATGTLLRMSETGFDQLPPQKREKVFRENDGGWTEQMKNIEAHVSKAP